LKCCLIYLFKKAEGFTVQLSDLIQNLREAAILLDDQLILKNKKEVMTRLGLDKNSYEEVANTFLVMVNDKIIQLEKKTAAEDPEKLCMCRNYWRMQFPLAPKGSRKFWKGFPQAKFSVAQGTTAPIVLCS